VGDVKTEEPGSLVVVPRPSHPHDNWLEIVEAGAAGGFTGAFGNDVYSGVKAACRAAVEKFRDRRSDPDEEREWLHQLVAEAFMGPCPPGHKLVHLNDNYLDNRRVNLAYVPESDPRPAAPLRPRPTGFFTTAVATNKTPVAAGKKRRKGKRKRS
jgi:HNH endonuclease